MRRATQHDCRAVWVVRISIHALHEESDCGVGQAEQEHDISIHALHEESDLPRSRPRAARATFQSTLSMRRATDAFWAWWAYVQISIHALHEESDVSHGVETRSHRISIHALHEESDSPAIPRDSKTSLFQSTLSMRRATRPRSGGAAEDYFNPRSP